jgi:hypothetical protein
MNKMTEEEFVDYIADLTHYKPNAIDELPLEETPLMLAFTDGGDQGDELTENEELLKYYHATETGFWGVQTCYNYTYGA